MKSKGTPKSLNIHETIQAIEHKMFKMRVILDDISQKAKRQKVVLDDILAEALNPLD